MQSKWCYSLWRTRTLCFPRSIVFYSAGNFSPSVTRSQDSVCHVIKNASEIREHFKRKKNYHAKSLLIISLKIITKGIPKQYYDVIALLQYRISHKSAMLPHLFPNVANLPRVEIPQVTSSMMVCITFLNQVHRCIHRFGLPGGRCPRGADGGTSQHTQGLWFSFSSRSSRQSLPLRISPLRSLHLHHSCVWLLPDDS